MSRNRQRQPNAAERLVASFFAPPVVLRGATVQKPVLARCSPTINRWTGSPHEHKREIARRSRQAERRAAR